MTKCADGHVLNYGVFIDRCGCRRKHCIVCAEYAWIRGCTEHPFHGLPDDFDEVAIARTRQQLADAQEAGRYVSDERDALRGLFADSEIRLAAALAEVSRLREQGAEIRAVCAEPCRGMGCTGNDDGHIDPDDILAILEAK